MAFALLRYFRYQFFRSGLLDSFGDLCRWFSKFLHRLCLGRLLLGNQLFGDWCLGFSNWSLFLDRLPDGTRVLQSLAGGDDWFGCFDTVQVNEEEFGQLGPDPLALRDRIERSEGPATGPGR